MLLWLGQRNIFLLEKGIIRQVEGIVNRLDILYLIAFVLRVMFMLSYVLGLCFPKCYGSGPVAWWMVDLNFTPFPLITTLPDFLHFLPH